MPRTKYRPCTPYRNEREETAHDRTGAPLTATIDVANVRQDGDTHVWHGGAHRVTFTAPKGTPKPRRRTFIGETAWSDAERYAYDALTAHRYRRP